MAFTDQSDLYGAVHEDGINLIVRHLMRLRPSLFNYGTEYVARNTHLLCHPIEADRMVYARNNPLLTVESPLPVLGTNGLINLNYCLQLVDARIDFHRRNIDTLPPEIGDIPPQDFALTAKACFGLGCPDGRFGELLENAMESIYDIISLNGLVNGDKNSPGNFTYAANIPERKFEPITVPVKSLKCFCLEVYALCHIETRKVGKQHILTTKLDNIEIVNITPDELENSIECYVGQVIRLGLLPRIRIALEKIVFDQLKIVSISVAPAPVANNPAIEDDQLKAFINMEVA
jgi:hypothetical protein